eukprot:3588821-Rhodomonas_salina.2
MRPPGGCSARPVPLGVGRTHVTPASQPGLHVTFATWSLCASYATLTAWELWCWPCQPASIAPVAW